VVAATSVSSVLPSSASRGRKFTAVARAERDGRLLCSAVLLVVSGPPGRLGVAPVEDMTAWFYGALEGRFELELEDLAEAGRGYTATPELEPVDLVIQADGGALRLEGCVLDVPVRVAGPASTLEFRIAHAGEPQRGLRLVA
jgi:hypothetical protein